MVYKQIFRDITNSCKRFITTLAIWCFIIGIGFIPDLDHILVLATKKIPITWNNLATQAGRPLHLAYMVIIIIITVWYIAHVNRLWDGE